MKKRFSIFMLVGLMGTVKCGSEGENSIPLQQISPPSEQRFNFNTLSTSIFTPVELRNNDKMPNSTPVSGIRIFPHQSNQYQDPKAVINALNTLYNTTIKQLNNNYVIKESNDKISQWRSQINDLRNQIKKINDMINTENNTIQSRKNSIVSNFINKMKTFEENNSDILNPMIARSPGNNTTNPPFQYPENFSTYTPEQKMQYIKKYFIDALIP